VTTVILSEAKDLKARDEILRSLSSLRMTKSEGLPQNDKGQRACNDKGGRFWSLLGPFLLCHCEER